jgi:hypothetical protein
VKNRKGMACSWVGALALSCHGIAALASQVPVTPPAPKPWLITAEHDYQAYLRRDRLLLVFAADENDPDYFRQMESVRRARAEFFDRDVVVISVLPGEPGGAMLRSRYGIRDPRSFTALFLDRGGSVKMRSMRAIPAQKVLDQARVVAEPRRD